MESKTNLHYCHLRVIGELVSLKDVNLLNNEGQKVTKLGHEVQLKAPGGHVKINLLGESQKDLVNPDTAAYLLALF